MKFISGGAPLGFWMAQQGSILCFVGLLIAYSFLMNRLDENMDMGRTNNGSNYLEFYFYRNFF